MEVDYEDTVADLESTARRLVDACGLEWEPSCLEFYRNDRPVRTASLTQVLQPIYTGSVLSDISYRLTKATKTRPPRCLCCGLVIRSLCATTEIG